MAKFRRLLLCGQNIIVVPSNIACACVFLIKRYGYTCTNTFFPQFACQNRIGSRATLERYFSTSLIKLNKLQDFIWRWQKVKKNVVFLLCSCFRMHLNVICPFETTVFHMEKEKRREGVKNLNCTFGGEISRSSFVFSFLGTGFLSAKAMMLCRP